MIPLLESHPPWLQCPWRSPAVVSVECPTKSARAEQCCQVGAAVECRRKSDHKPLWAHAQTVTAHTVEARHSSTPHTAHYINTSSTCFPCKLTPQTSLGELAKHNRSPIIRSLMSISYANFPLAPTLVGQSPMSQAEDHPASRSPLSAAARQLLQVFHRESGTPLPAAHHTAAL